MPAMPLNSRPLTVVCPADLSSIERHAVATFCREVAAAGAAEPAITDAPESLPPGDLLVLGQPGTNPWLERLAARLPTPLRLPADDFTHEGFALRSLDLDGRRAVLALGASPRGVLWAVCELLDAAWLAGDSGVLPQVDAGSAPRSTLRGLQYYTPRVPGGVADSLLPERVAEYKSDIDYAVRLRMNFLTLGLDWPGNFSALVTHRHFPALAGLVDEAAIAPRAAMVQDLLQHATSRGMQTYLTLVELVHPPELGQRHPEALATAPAGGERWYSPPGSGFTSLANPHKVCPSHPVTRAFFRAKVRELAERFPLAQGVELWVSHADSDLFFCDCPVCRQVPPHERMARLCHDALEAMDAVHPAGDRRVLLRTYLGGWRQALEQSFYGPLEQCLSPRVVVGHKAQYGDMYYGNAIHPLAGTLPAHDEYVEFCLGGEYRAGLRWGLVAPVADDYVVRRARAHAVRGLAGVSFRHLPWRNRFNEIDFRIFGAAAWNPHALSEPIWQRWAAERFGAAGPGVVEILRGCTDVMSHTLYANGVSLTHWAVFPENLQRLRHLTMDRSAQATEDGWQRVEPTPRNLRRLVEEKVAAERRAATLLAGLERLHGVLAGDDYSALRSSLVLWLTLAGLFRGLVDCFWRFLIWERTLSEIQRDWQRTDLQAALAGWRAYIAAARPVFAAEYGPALFEALGTRPALWQAGMRREGYYLEHLEQIASDIEQAIDVQPASVWGYFPRLDGAQ